MSDKVIRNLAIGLVICGGWCAISGSSAQTTTYKYDALGRLVEVHRLDESINEYAYDAAGNRTSAKSYPSSYPPPAPVNGPFEDWMVPVLLGR